MLMKRQMQWIAVDLIGCLNFNIFWKKLNTGEDNAMDVVLHFLVLRNSLDGWKTDFTEGFYEQWNQNAAELREERVVQELFLIVGYYIFSQDSCVINKVAGDRVFVNRSANEFHFLFGDVQVGICSNFREHVHSRVVHDFQSSTRSRVVQDFRCICNIFHYLLDVDNEFSVLWIRSDVLHEGSQAFK